jgi:cation:H+ antiporter
VKPLVIRQFEFREAAWKRSPGAWEYHERRPQILALLKDRVAAVKPILTWLETAGGPWAFVGLFLLASFVMIWRLESMTRRGMEGTVLGTLIMPYCSGMGNLVFAFLLGSRKDRVEEVITNSLVNNVTNLTLLIGLPTVIWGLNVIPAAAKKKGKKPTANKAQELDRLSLLLTLMAVFFFTGALWALSRDKRIDFGDGLVLVGLFLFWQTFHVFDVMKRNVGKPGKFGLMLPVDLVLLAVGAYAVYLSTDWLVGWVSRGKSGLFSPEYMGWLSGWLMVVPNALLAFYYSWRGNPEIVYSSQVGDGHICIPLCIGICALYQTIKVPDVLWLGTNVLFAAALFHVFMVALWGRLPRFAGVVLLLAYLVFLAKGLG